MFQVMLVEDDIRLSELIAEYLNDYEFNIDVIHRGDLALEHFNRTQPDLVILDLMLPGRDGSLICKQIREISAVPIMILTAREDSFDQISCLEQGADDFISKPVQPRILLARLRALVRRQSDKKVSKEIVFGTLCISKDNRSVRWKGQPVTLNSSEYKLLMILVDAAGTVLSRDDILKKMRGIEFDGLDRSIDNSISRLRKKFDDHSAEKIKTVWGEGYLFSPSAWG